MRAMQLLDAVAGADPRTHRLAFVLVAIVLLVATVVVTLSANASIASARESVLRQRAMLDIARARTKESASLAPSGAPARLALHDAIDKVLREQGVTYRRTGDVEQGTAEAIVIDAVPFDVLVRALDRLARDHGVRAIDASIAARVDPGSVRGELTLAR
jgi:type II secretory pathway component PulM